MARFLFMDYSIIIRRNRVIETITLYHRKKEKKKAPKGFLLTEDIVYFVCCDNICYVTVQNQFHIQVKKCHKPSISKS